MAYIKVDIEKVRSINTSLPTVIKSISNSRNGVDRLRGNIDSKIQNRMNIGVNLLHVYSLLGTVETKLDFIYKNIDSYMNKYQKCEKNLYKDALSIIDKIGQIKACNDAYTNLELTNINHFFRESPDITNQDIIDHGSQIVAYVRNPDNFMGFYKYLYFSEFIKDRNTLWDSIVISATDKLGEVKALINGQSYKQKLMEDSLGEILKSLNVDYQEAQTIPSEVKDIAKIFSQLKKIDKINLNEKWKSTKNYKKLITNKSFLDDMAKIGKAVDWGNFSVEQIEIWLNDYSSNISYLNSLKQALIVSGRKDVDLENVIDNLTSEYKDKWIASIKDLTYKIQSKLVDKSIDLGANLITGGLYSVADLGMELVLRGHNVDDYGDDLKSLYILENYKNSLVTSYDYYADRIRSGSYTEEDTTQCQKMFELSKAAVIKEYRLMYRISDNKQEKIKLMDDLKKIVAASYNKME